MKEGDMPTIRVRQDIWELGTETEPWHPVIEGYAKAVRAMMDLAGQTPGDPRSWVNQAAIHERNGPSVFGRLEAQCQHGCWFFLPWHRMYLWQFEQIIRSHLGGAGDDWALPYWNYSDNPDHRKLPPAFRTETLPDGSSNALYTEDRNTAGPRVNAGEPLDGVAVSVTDAMAEQVFARSTPGTTAGFGGGRTNPLFHHSAAGPAGPLEITPHGSVHVQVGGPNGLMASFGTAALDPIFWLHHANIDRLWEVWRRAQPPRANPADSAWLSMGFDLIDETGARAKMQVNDVLDTAAQLGYTYAGLPAPAPAAAEKELIAMTDGERPAEMIGAVEEPVVLAGAARAKASVKLAAPRRPREAGLIDSAPATYLHIEDVVGEANPGLLYGIYVNLADGDEANPDSPHFAGTVSFFGIEVASGEGEGEEAPHRLHYAFNISNVVERLRAEGRWDPNSLDVTFAPVRGLERLGQAAAAPTVQIGRVSVYVQ
jgi:tyrosinase